MKSFFHEFLSNLTKIFNWPNMLWHMLVIALTYVIVISGFDWYYFEITRSISFKWLWLPAGMLGFLLVLLPLILYFVGKFYNNPRLLNTAFAEGQTLILASLVSSFYKACRF